MVRYERSEGRGRGDDSSSRDSGRGERKFEDYTPKDRRSSSGGRFGSSRDSGRDRRDSDRSDRRGSSNRNPHARKYNDRGSDRGSSGRRDFEMTKVTCSECGKDCEVPFKPTTNKPLFCDQCFKKNEKSGSNDEFNSDLTIIKQKLNMIMKALKIGE